MNIGKVWRETPKERCAHTKHEATATQSHLIILLTCSQKVNQIAIDQNKNGYLIFPDVTCFIGDPDIDGGQASVKQPQETWAGDRIRTESKGEETFITRAVLPGASSPVSGYKQHVPQAVEAPHAVLAVRAPPNGKRFQFTSSRLTNWVQLSVLLLLQRMFV